MTHSAGEIFIVLFYQYYPIKTWAYAIHTEISSLIQVYGIGVTGENIDGVVIRDNLIHHYESWSNAHGILVYGEGGTSSSSIRNILIDNNTVRDMKTGSSESIAINGNVERWAITNNTITNVNNIAIDAIGGEGTSPAQTLGSGRVLPGELDKARYGFILNNVVQNMSTVDNPAYDNEHSWAAAIYVDGGSYIKIDNNNVSNAPWAYDISAENCLTTSHITLSNNRASGSRFGDLLMGGYAEGGYLVDSSIGCDPGVTNDDDEGHGYVDRIRVQGNQLLSTDSLEGRVYLQYRLRGAVVLDLGLQNQYPDENGSAPGDENAVLNYVPGNSNVFIVSPIAGSTLSGSSETFQWSSIPGASTYRLWLGGSAGGDEYGRFASSGTSVNATGLPTDGSSVYATLKWNNGYWHTESSVVYTASFSPTFVAISNPVAGSVLSGTREIFQWAEILGATAYRVWLGSTPGGDEYGRLSSTGSSATTSNLPTDGSTVYATLKWNDGSWHTEPSVSYTAFVGSPAPVISSPVAGGALSGTSQIFQWTTTPGATAYRVWLGSTSGGDEYGRLASTGTSTITNNLPTDGSLIYATLKWNDGSWHTEPTVSYTAATSTPVFISPISGSIISGGTVTFVWNAFAGATTYRVWMGSTVGGDEYGRFASSVTSRTVAGLATDGRTIYATLKWNDGSWHTEPSVAFVSGP